jgi:predicted protein tyrosine phosphatase
MTAEQIEASLRSLLHGKFSSLTIGFNENHAANYVTAKGWRDEYGFYAADDKDVINWASEEERQKAISDNSVWTLQWYPETPVGFHCIGASSLSALIAAAALNRPQGPEEA